MIYAYESFNNRKTNKNIKNFLQMPWFKRDHFSSITKMLRTNLQGIGKFIKKKLKRPLPHCNVRSIENITSVSQNTAYNLNFWNWINIKIRVVINSKVYTF